MSRINTNVSSLVAQKTLGRNNADLQEALTRLSTGLRINAGKDDPAGLIASENLRADITSVNKAITNSSRANQLIATADAALGQVSNLLNDIRGLVVEASNSGALSDEQVAANQLQIDSSLEAIDRIAQTTTFQGKTLLDGSLNFLTVGGTGFSTVSDLEIDQANLGAAGSISVEVDITAAANRGSITVAPTNVSTLTVNNQSFTLTAAAGTDGVSIDVASQTVEANGNVTLSNQTFAISLAEGETDDLIVNHAKATAEAVGSFTLDSNTFSVSLADAQTAVNVDVDVSTAQFANIGTVTLDSAVTLTINSTTNAVTGTSNIVVNFAETNIGANAAAATFSSNTLTVTIDDDTTVAASDVAAAIASVTEFSSATVTGNADATAQDHTVVASATLSQAEADVNYTTGTTGTLAITLNSDDTNISASALATTIQGLTEIGTASQTAGDNTLDGSAVTVATLATISQTDVIVSSTSGSGTRTLGITLNSNNASIAASDIEAAIEAKTEFANGVTTTGSGGVDGNATVPTASTYTISDVSAAYDSATEKITLTIDKNATSITATSIQNALSGLSPISAASGGGTVNGANTTAETDAASLNRIRDLIVRISGKDGSEVFNFQGGTTLAQVQSAINLVTDATGITASESGGTLAFTTSGYGSDAFVDIEVISEGTGGTFESLLSSTRATGSDIAARVNGVQAEGVGNSLSINTATLDLSLTVADGSSTNVNFTISGGGATFQLGPDVVSNQQARIGIQNLNTGSLGGANGRLYELRSGNARALKTDATGAGKIVDDTITKIAQTRGRLGAFQRTTLDTNIASLNDYLSNLTEAESAIRDADFAAESAALTRAQVLVQSGTSVLAIANQNPQNVLALLR